jgi:AraC-like DNA-binding protein
MPDHVSQTLLDAVRKLARVPDVEALVDRRLGDLLELVQDSETSDPAHVWTDAVREILAAQLDRRALTLPSAARALAVSARTLQRRLAEEGTSWRAELDAARRERTAQLLGRGRTKDATAASVGYSDSRALRRAVRRWQRDEVDASGPQIGVLRPPWARARSAQCVPDFSPAIERPRHVQ